MRHRVFTFLCAVFVAATAAQRADALANRVFVSARSGNNANSCDNVLTPCQTLAGAVLQLNPGGEAIVLDSGGYGPVTITQSVTIEAPPGVTAFVHPPSGDAITISAGSGDTVILRGLTLNGGSGNGITANTVGRLFVEKCVITGYAAGGIYFGASGGTLFVRDVDVRACAGNGIFVTSAGAASRAVIRDSAFHKNNNGIEAASGSVVTVTGCVAAENFHGFVVDTAGAADADLTLDRVQAIANTRGLAAIATGGKTATLRFTGSVVTQNATGVFISGGTALGSSPGTSLVAGNGSDVSGTLGTPITLD